MEQCWAEALFFYTEYRSIFANGYIVAHPLKGTERRDFLHAMVFHGLLFRESSYKGDTDFLPWLWAEARQAWGTGEDLCRVGLLVHVDAKDVLKGEALTHRRWSATLPCPVLCCLSPEQDWQRWEERHTSLFGKSACRFIQNA